MKGVANGRVHRLFQGCPMKGSEYADQAYKRMLLIASEGILWSENAEYEKKAPDDNSR